MKTLGGGVGVNKTQDKDKDKLFDINTLTDDITKAIKIV